MRPEGSMGELLLVIVSAVGGGCKQFRVTFETGSQNGLHCLASL